MDLKQGDYLATIITRKDGGTYVAYFRVLSQMNYNGMVEFVDDTGTLVRMQPRYAAKLRKVYPQEVHPEIDLSRWQD